MKISAVREIGFDYGHRVYGHESKCATFHGHRGKVEIFCQAEKGLDSLGRVIDFSVIKSKIGTWIDTYWDHAMVVWIKDPDLHLIEQCSGYKRPFLMPSNPTAENMAKYLLTEIAPHLLNGTGVEITKIVFWETPNCKVEVSLAEAR